MYEVGAGKLSAITENLTPGAEAGNHLHIRRQHNADESSANLISREATREDGMKSSLIFDTQAIYVT